MENIYLFTIGLLLILVVYLALKSNHHEYWHKHYKELNRDNELKRAYKQHAQYVKSLERKQKYNLK